MSLNFSVNLVGRAMIWLNYLCVLILATNRHFTDSSKLSDGNFGSLKLCPPGGASFVEAWSLACTMRRRKRSVDFDDQQDAQSPVQFRSNSFHHRGQQLTSLQNDIQHVLMKRKLMYRPATLTEMMRICCVHGCELVDLWAYCDPFGPWDS